MRKRFYTMITAAVAFCSIFSAPAFGAALPAQVDTIVLETEEAAEEDLPADLGWKTEQDNGKWIESMGFAADAKSLVLVVNNMNGDGETETLAAEAGKEKTRPRRRQVAGNSRLLYFSKTENGDWQENFSINCFVSGGAEENDHVYGVYRLESAFGSKENPGSLVPYQQLTAKDYWITDPEEEGFGFIQHAGPKGAKTSKCVFLEEMRAYSNYGMILKPETEGEAYPALIVNCQQSDTMNRRFGGVQLSESYVRMLIQSIDTETRIIIAGEVEDMEGM